MTASRSARQAGRSAGVALVAAGAALWGLDGVIRAPLLDRWSTWTIVLYEHVLLSALVAAGLWRARGALSRITPRGWLSVLVIAWGGSALATLAYTSAFKHGNPTVVVLLQKTQPLWAVFAAALVLGERPRRRLATIALPALFGTYLLSFGWSSPVDAMRGGAGGSVALALVAAGLWGASTAFGRRALAEARPGVVMGLRFTVALPLLAALALANDAAAPPAAASAGDWLRIVLVALVPGLIALALYYRGLDRIPASVATFAELAFPATSIVAGYLFLDATLSADQLLGFAIVWLSILALHREGGYRLAVARLRRPERAPAPI